MTRIGAIPIFKLFCSASQQLAGRALFVVPMLLGVLVTAQNTPHIKGAAILPKNEYLRIPVAPAAVAGKLPNSVTLEDLFPKPGSQGHLPSCAAWAVSYNKAYRIYLALGRQGRPDDYLQSPAFLDSAATNGHCNQSVFIPSALYVAKTVGSVSWADLPYTDDACPAWRSFLGVARYNSFYAYRLNADPGDALDDIRGNLVAGNPVIVAIRACSELDQLTTGVVSTASTSGSCDNHALLVVGYDDDQQAVRVLNSWGDSWGDHGKAWIKYSVFKQRLLEAYVDFGPGGEAYDNLAWLSDPRAAPGKGVPTVTPEVLRKSLRANIDPRILGVYPPYHGEAVRVSIWSIWMNLPREYASQIRTVGYYFLHPTFKHNPQKSLPDSSVFLAQWRGWGCVDSAYLIAELTDGQKVKVDFNFCDVTQHATYHPGQPLSDKERR